MAFEDDRRAWMPLLAIGVIIIGLAIGLLVVARNDDDDGVTGTLPTSFPSLPSETTSPATAPPPTSSPASAPDTATVGTISPNTTGTAQAGDADAALADLASQASASQVTPIVRIGSGQYAMLLATGTGRLVRWNGTAWEDAATIDPPGIIDKVQAADVTGDGEAEFVVSLGGLDQQAGVYGQQGFSFDFLPFNTTTGLQDFVDGLVYRFGQLESPFGGRTLIWTWTGRMFETR